MTALNADSFFTHQLATWPLCRQRYEELSHAERRTINVAERDYTLIHNPLRTKSATAQVADGTLDRPCFLCQAHRPQEQEYLTITPYKSKNTYHLAVNPYPILTHHFTIIDSRHCRQTITPQRLSDMAAMARQMRGYLLFFNGASSGASAPDHFHFQAVRQADVPLFTWQQSTLEALFIQTCEADRVKIDYDQTDMMNILCWVDDDKTHWIVVQRHAHRPRQYFAEGAEQLLISPAALEYAGVIPLVRQTDYTRLTPTTLADIMRQCYDNEPLVDVGIDVCHPIVTPNSDGTTTIQGVTIGKNFHWEDSKTFTYEGKILPRTDKVAEENYLINRLEAEKYLYSVIASEMSATANLPLLKAHAVIARSWLVHLMSRKQQTHTAGNTSKQEEKAAQEREYIRWYDAEAHREYDVCADDHCQRYQGLPAKARDRVARAIEETRGEVLMWEGKVIDARYSKCCGGRTEEYSYCWENIHLPYLTSVPDTRPDGSIFCKTQDKAILSQVLNDYDQATTDFFAWHVTYTQAELSEIIERKGGFGLGQILALDAVERGRSGRISKLKITGEHGTIIVGKELEIRRLLSKTHLYSSNFEVATTREATGDLIFSLHGHGWGHGVGLCQIGAAVMGTEGYDYKDILLHYYKHCEIATIW